VPSEPLPLTPLQKAMLAHSLGSPELGMYITQPIYEFKDICIDSLRFAINSTLNRHEILRSSFHQNESEAYLVVNDYVECEIELQDWSDENSEFKKKQRLRHFLANDRRRSFDFKVAPLIRPIIIKITDNQSLLIFTHHHILLDGISSPIVSQEILATYNAKRTNLPLPRFPKRRPYREYINWFNHKNLDQAKDFWKEYFSGFSNEVDLPCLNRYSTVANSVESDVARTLIETKIVESIEEVSKKLNTTLNAIFLASLSIVFSQYTGQDDFIIGVLFNGRPYDLPGSETMVGMFMNTLPFRSRIEHNIRLIEYIKRVNTDLALMNDHQFLSLSEIRNVAGIDNQENIISCILDNKISLTKSFYKNSAESIVAKSDVKKNSQTSMAKQDVPLHFNLEATPAGVEFTITFDKHRFSSELIALFLKSFQYLSTQIDKSLDSLVRNISIFNEQDYSQIRNLQQGKTITFDDTLTASDLFFSQVDRTPSNIALAFESECLSYLELSAKTRSLISTLQKYGISPNTKVAFQVPRNIDLVLLVLALLKIGAAYIPVDESVPHERCQSILAISEAKFFVGSISLELVKNCTYLSIDVLIQESRSCKQAPLSLNKFTNDHLAYILFTSGSTGTPKGIRIPHRVIVSRILSDPFPPIQPEVILSKTSYAFVDFIWELFIALSSGSCCHLLSTKDCKDPHAIVKSLIDHNVRRIVLVPSLLSLILEQPQDTLSSICSVQYWFATGEPLPASLAAKFYLRIGNSTLYNLYGASEVWDISLSQVPSNVDESSQITAGHPLPNTSIFILNQHGCLVPPGVIGELHISGKHIAEGYQVRTCENESFKSINLNGNIIDVWSSGDLGFWSSRGELVIQGRSDSLVKLRGFRIDLNEVELYIKQNMAVLDCAVIVINRDTLAAVVVLAEESLQIQIVKNALKVKLPDYMIPSVWLTQNTLPYLTSGKIDRKQLQHDLEGSTSLLSTKAENSEILSKTESLVLELASQLLPSVDLNIDSNFFESGGHSLMAIRLLSKLSKVLEKRVPLESIFTHPSFRQLASHVDALTTGALSLPTRQISYSDLSPLSLPQRRLWIVDSLNPGADTYILTNIVSFDFRIKSSSLFKALEALIKRHAALRTRFVTHDGEPFQIVDTELSPPLLRLPDENDHLAEVKKCLLSPQNNWDLSHGPLFHVYLCSSSTSSTLGLQIHHIISDGASIKIFFDDLIAIYQNISAGRPTLLGLANLPLDYRDYAIWQHDLAFSVDYDYSLQYWQNTFENRPLQLEFFIPNHIESFLPDTTSRSITTRIGPVITRRLRKSALNRKSTLFNLLLALYGLFLSRHVGESQISIGAPITGRDNEDYESIIGFFVDLVIYPIDIDESLTFYQLIDHASVVSQNAIRHSIVPFDQIVRAVSPERNKLSQPLFQAMLVHEVVTLGSSHATSAGKLDFYTSEHANYDYLLLVREYPEHLELTHHVRARLFTTQMLKDMSNRLYTLCSRLSALPAKVLSNISMLPSAEYYKLTKKWNNTHLLNPHASRTFVNLFIERSFNHPDHIIVVDAVKSWTRKDICLLVELYQEILSSIHPQIDQPICMCLPKSAHQVAVALTISTLGFPFVPIDPNTPTARKQSIIDSSNSGVIFYTEELTDIGQLDCPHKICIDPTTSHIKDNFEATQLFDHSTPDQIAYICFTSGSTGKPKGVLVSQFNLISLLYAHSQYFRLNESSRVLSTLGFYFDAGIGEQYRSLYSGSCLYFSEADLLKEPSRLKQELIQHRITHVGIPPSVLDALDPQLSDSLTDLQVLVTAGESISMATASVWGNNRRIISGHGATETTVGDTIAFNWDLSQKAPLGKPLPNMEAFVLDKYLQICPPYVVGELAITGPQVSQGYLLEPAKTSASFVNLSQHTDSPYKTYLTGDLAYWSHNGTLFFAGRKDKQLKIRGYRIEPAEIEAAACRHPNITHAVSISMSLDGHTSLVLYIVCNADPPLDLIETLEDSLPPYMIPSHVIPIANIPKTSNGKIDYRALPIPSVPKSDEPIIKPSTDTEKLLHRIWTQILKLDQISVTSSFFALGGDSIQAIQVLTACNSSSLPLSALEFFSHQSIRGLAAHIESRP